MAHPNQESQSVYAQAFRRDKYRCVYCGKDLLESLDSFAASHLDHLKPKKHGGPDDDVWNRVTACSVCNSIKHAYDPHPSGLVTEKTFEQALTAAREFIADKRTGKQLCDYYTDYQHWLKESGRQC